MGIANIAALRWQFCSHHLIPRTLPTPLCYTFTITHSFITMLPQETIKAISDNLFNAHYANFMENCFLQAWDVHMIQETQEEYDVACARADKEIKEIGKRISELEGKKDKLSRDQAKNLKNFILPTRINQFNLLKVKRSDLYKTISDRADKIDEGREKLEFRKAFTGYIPKLPFLEIEGTRYEVTETNEVKFDDKGNKVLYIKNEKAKN